MLKSMKKKSLSAADSIGSFFGVSETEDGESCVDLWHERQVKRIQSGEFGFKASGLIPSPKLRNQTKVMNELETALQQLSQDDLQTDIDSVPSKASLVNLSGTDRDILLTDKISSANHSELHSEEPRGTTSEHEDCNIKDEEGTQQNLWEKFKHRLSTNDLTKISLDQVEIATTTLAIPDGLCNSLEKTFEKQNDESFIAQCSLHTMSCENISENTESVTAYKGNTRSDNTTKSRALEINIERPDSPSELKPSETFAVHQSGTDVNVLSKGIVSNAADATSVSLLETESGGVSCTYRACKIEEEETGEGGPSNNIVKQNISVHDLMEKYSDELLKVAVTYPDEFQLPIGKTDVEKGNGSKCENKGSSQIPLCENMLGQIETQPCNEGKLISMRSEALKIDDDENVDTSSYQCQTKLDEMATTSRYDQDTEDTSLSWNEPSRTETAPCVVDNKGLPNNASASVETHVCHEESLSSNNYTLAEIGLLKETVSVVSKAQTDSDVEEVENSHQWTLNKLFVDPCLDDVIGAKAMPVFGDADDVSVKNSIDQSDVLLENMVNDDKQHTTDPDHCSDSNAGPAGSFHKVETSHSELRQETVSIPMKEVCSDKQKQVADDLENGETSSDIYHPKSEEAIKKRHESVKFSDSSHYKHEPKLSLKESHSIEQEDECHEKIDVVYGSDGYKHYKILAEIEKNIKLAELMEGKQQLFEQYRWKIKTIDEVVKLARAYYADPKGKVVDDWQKLRGIIAGKSDNSKKSMTHVRVQLGRLPDFVPWFTFSLILIQIMAVVCLCIFGGFSSIAVEPELMLKHEVTTFLGSETVHKWDVPNIWIGPNAWFLIGVGSMYAPCMRDDINIRIEYLKRNYSTEMELGCCEAASRNTAGTTTEEECESFSSGTAIWRRGVLCNQRKSGQNSVAHILKPCCVDIMGTCLLVSHTHCIFLGGVFHVTGNEHCSQVNCLEKVCKIGTLENDEKVPGLPKNPSQWWRIFVSLVYHYGIIHMVLVITVEFFLVRPIEQGIGWLRVILLYIITGVTGLMFGALFSPYQPHVGATGALSGFLGVLLVELVYFWKIIPHPRTELAKLLAALFFFFLAGTLPYINNFTLFGGFLSGILFGPLFLPYVTFGRWHKRCRFFIVSMSVPLIVASMFILVYIFYKVQIVENCEVCQYLNCLPFTDKMCNVTLWNYR